MHYACQGISDADDGAIVSSPRNCSQSTTQPVLVGIVQTTIRERGVTEGERQQRVIIASLAAQVAKPRHSEPTLLICFNLAKRRDDSNAVSPTASSLDPVRFDGIHTDPVRHLTAALYGCGKI